jgi:thymidylate kinase
MSASLPSRSPRLPSLSSGIERAFVEEQVPELLGEDVCLLHPRLGYDSGPGGGDFDFAVREIDLQWPLRAIGARVCQCIRHSPGGWYWVVETPDDVFAIDALDDPHGIGQLNFPTVLAFEADDGEIAATRAAFVTMKRLVKRMRGRAKWDPIIAMAGTDPRSYAKCLDACLGSRLGQRVSRPVLAGRIPDDGVWRRSSLALRLRRIRTPQRAAILLLRSMERLVGRFGHPTGLLVVVVGPDGAGKSALASSLMARCGAFFWKSRRIHWRPSLLPRLGAFVGGRPTDPETPHRSTPHGRMTSIAVLLYYWVDFLLGTWLKLNPLRVRSALIVVERGWWDILVDPRRYRLQVPPGLTAALGRLLPNPDLTLVLDAPAAALAQRKQELPKTELDRQRNLWRELAGRAGGSYSLVDASQQESVVQMVAAEEVISRLEKRTAARTGPGWVELHDSGKVRWMIPRGPRRSAHEGLLLFQPMTVKGRLVWEVARRAARLGSLQLLPRGDAPDRAIRQALAPHIPPRGTIAVARSNHAGRFVALIIDGGGKATALAKVALNEDARGSLEREASALRTLAPHLSAPLKAPRILEQDEGLLLVEPIRWRPRTRPWELPADVAHSLGRFHARGATTERGFAHGDFAPWNLLRANDAWVAVDWESSEREAPPFYDLFHFLVQACALLGRPTQSAILEGIAEADGEVAPLISAYARGAGVPVRDAGRHFLTYLHMSRSTLIPSAPDFGTGMRVREEFERRFVTGSFHHRS